MTAADRFARLPELLAADPDLQRRARFLSAPFRVDIGVEPFHLALRDGTLAGFERGPRLLRAVAFVIGAADEAWQAHWAPVPEPGWHDLFALAKRGALTLEGDLRPLLQNLQAVKDLLALPRIDRTNAQ